MMQEINTNQIEKQPWEPMVMTYHGQVNQIILQGGGKNSPAPTDPGEDRKVRPPNPEGF
jgi:hypothetical protein